jgi:hypothetical protein
MVNYVDRVKTTVAGLRLSAPTRPIVIIQSDDWGRVGVPSIDALERLKSRNIDVGKDPWDYYGLETEEDVIKLGDVLAAVRDRDGRSACLTANFIMANADLRAMRAQAYREFRWIGIADGFPAPWTEKLFAVYLANIERKVFYPGLHGFTHFNIPGMLRALSDSSGRGELTRILAEEDIPYLASLTPEYNFALLTRGQGGGFLDEAEQAEWIEQGVALFRQGFGFSPRTTCAPGYNANTTTFRIWHGAGIDVVQTSDDRGLAMNGSISVLNRNVHFEPALHPDAALESALSQAHSAIARGRPIVISTHSINYISRHLGRAQQSRAMLRELLSSLLRRFPNLRFASDADFSDAHKSAAPSWFRPPNAGELTQRVAAVARRNLIASEIQG